MSTTICGSFFFKEPEPDEALIDNVVFDKDSFEIYGNEFPYKNYLTNVVSKISGRVPDIPMFARLIINMIVFGVKYEDNINQIIDGIISS